jgi:hypothetical protein
MEAPRSEALHTTMALARLRAGAAGEETAGRTTGSRPLGGDRPRLALGRRQRCAPSGQGRQRRAVDLGICMRKQTGRGCLARPAATAQQGTLGRCAPRLGASTPRIARPAETDRKGREKPPALGRALGEGLERKHHTCSAPRSACSFPAPACPALIWINRTQSESDPAWAAGGRLQPEQRRCSGVKILRCNKPTGHAMSVDERIHDRCCWPPWLRRRGPGRWLFPLRARVLH